MAQAGYTPILIYASGTSTNVPLAANLTSSATGAELAINYVDGKLFYKDSSGVVQVLATKGGVGTSSNTQVLYNSSGLVVGSANMTFDGTNINVAGLIQATGSPSNPTGTTSSFYNGSGVGPTISGYQFAIRTGGTPAESLRVDNNGNVGIGTSSPLATLDVNAAAARIRLASSTGTNNALLSFTNTSGTSYVGLDNSAGGLTAAYALNLYQSGAYPITFSTNSAERMRIDSSGNVGIGTSSPSTKLHVSGGRSSFVANSDAYALSVGYASLGAYYIGANSGNDSLLFSNSAGSEKMRIDSSGNVGISTTAPIAKLDVGGALTDTVPATYGGTIRVNSATQTTVQAIGGIEFPVAGDGYGYKMQQISSGGANLVFANRQGSATWTERVRIDTTGNVGIGVTPSAWNAGNNVKALQIGTFGAMWQQSSGAINVGANTYEYAASAFKYITSNPATLYSQDTGIGIHTWSTAASGTAGDVITFSERMRIDSSGNVGIGTSSPATKLDVYAASGNTTMQMRVGNGAQASVKAVNSRDYIQIAVDGSAVYVDGGTSSPMLFYTNSSERMRIDSNGNLLVGTTSVTNNPYAITSKFVVSGDFTGNFGQSITDTNTSAVNHYFVSFNLGLGGTNQKGYIYYNNGTGTVLLSATSDSRLKENIIDAPSVLPILEKIKVRQYDWKDTKNTNMGFIAQELNDVIPRAVNIGEDNEDGSIKRPWSVDNVTLIPYLTKAIQEQQALIESLTTRLTALENK